jgi:hypothetical protein
MNIQKAYNIALKKAREYTCWGGGFIDNQLDLGDVYYFGLDYYNRPKNKRHNGGCSGFYVNKETGKLTEVGSNLINHKKLTDLIKKYQPEYYRKYYVDSDNEDDENSLLHSFSFKDYKLNEQS